ncbi:U2 small nuclear ribonucleoprotein auxiliary factor 35 kDa subunit-related protein 2 [Phymastichus coffea]|uniref:U2 small nuclear ribonucleoprotein auxiliary factor 35 kDa subunit-related protein 2 n=1 Tax=Phymastichus coffea TaxID=108790 RepID=UPI00273BEBD6|nr:U2 small nuclear ribonucleoprotein auxiliary factor 35 kDa subunit-related protein 2 [Phymastichus coffea]
MESELPKRPSHRDWRRQVKKQRRKRLRQKAARERDQEEQRLQLVFEQSEDYLHWFKEQEHLRQEEEKRAREEHDRLEKAWLEAEVKAQKEWAILQERKAKAREVQLAQEEIIRKEFEAMQENSRKKKEAERRRRDEQKKLFERMKKEIDAYIDDGSRTPKVFRTLSETQPGKEICPFFTKTGACRYGDICSRNHQRPGLSTVILVPNFYTHYSLERHSYHSDDRLEYDHRETRNHFRDFYFDVVPELEKFGKIKTLQYCKNTEAHLRGNLYVEYYTEREAARALRGLKGRWYAGRQLHCEFVNLKSWRGAICGMMRCPKGSSCNFLHVFKNPSEEYNVKSPPLWQKRQEQFESNSSRDSSSRRGSSRRSNWEDRDQDRNWRWSESPEPDNRRHDRGRPNQYNNRPMQRNFQPRNQYNNRGGFDNRRNDRNFYDNRRGRNFNNRFDDRRGRQHNFNDRFKRRYSDSDNNDDYGSKMRRRERRSRSPRSRSGSRSRSISRSPSRSRSRSRSPRSRSISRSMSRSKSRSHSPPSRGQTRSRTRSRSPIRQAPADDGFNNSKRPKERPREMRPIERPSRSASVERKRRPPSPEHEPREQSFSKEMRPPPSRPASKWDSEKRESSPEGQRSRSRSRSASPYNKAPAKKNSSQKSQQRHPQEYSKPTANSKSNSQKEYEWDTTDSEHE